MHSTPICLTLAEDIREMSEKFNNKKALDNRTEALIINKDI